MTSRSRLGALVLALALVGACSSGDDDTSKRVATASDDRATTTVQRERTTTTAADAGSAAAPTTGTGSGGTPSAKPGPGSPAANRDAVPGPAAAGTYSYAQSGTMPDGRPAPSNGTLAVSGGQTQTFHRSFSPGQSVTLTYDFRGDGPHVTAATVRSNGITIDCPFGGVPVPPWPPAPGRTFGGSATCSNGVTATLSGTLGARTNKGGHDVVRIDSTLRITGSGADVTVTDVEDWAVDLRLPTFSQQTFRGATPFGPVDGQVTSTLTGTP